MTCRHKPDVLIICGSGLSNLSDDIEDQEIVEYANCPGFPLSTVQGHGKRLVFGKLGGKVTYSDLACPLRLFGWALKIGQSHDLA